MGVDLDASDEREPELEPDADIEAELEPEPGVGDGVGDGRDRVARLATLAGLIALVAVVGLSGWLGFGAYQAHQSEQHRQLFLQVGRQGALNLTTIDWQQSDADVQRVLDSATGTFYDDFSTRSGPFIDVVKSMQSKSVGTISAAGLESESGDEAQVLVAVSVKTSNRGAQEQEPRSWRMRISVQKVAGEAKVSNVAFVP